MKIIVDGKNIKELNIQELRKLLVEVEDTYYELLLILNKNEK